MSRARRRGLPVLRTWPPCQPPAWLNVYLPTTSSMVRRQSRPRSAPSRDRPSSFARVEGNLHIELNGALEASAGADNLYLVDAGGSTACTGASRVLSGLAGALIVGGHLARSARAMLVACAAGPRVVAIVFVVLTRCPHGSAFWATTIARLWFSKGLGALSERCPYRVRPSIIRTREAGWL